MSLGILHRWCSPAGLHFNQQPSLPGGGKPRQRWQARDLIPRLLPGPVRPADGRAEHLHPGSVHGEVFPSAQLGRYVLGGGESDKQRWGDSAPVQGELGCPDVAASVQDPA